MTDSYIAAKIRRVKLDPRYTEILQLQRLPMPEPEELRMDPAPATADPQASTSQEFILSSSVFQSKPGGGGYR